MNASAPIAVTQPFTGTSEKAKHFVKSAHHSSVQAGPVASIHGEGETDSKPNKGDIAAPTDLVDCKPAPLPSSLDLGEPSHSETGPKAPFSRDGYQATRVIRGRKAPGSLDLTAITRDDGPEDMSDKTRSLLDLVDAHKQQLSRDQAKIDARLAEPLSKEAETVMREVKKAVVKKRNDINSFIELLLPAITNRQSNENKPDAFYYRLMELEYYSKLRLVMAQDPQPQYI
ncbi:MAG: hypothetical protein Q9163_000207 [Psora crenata]